MKHVRFIAMMMVALIVLAACAPAPTPTPVPTPVPLSATPVPPTATTVPPTATAAPPKATAIPPTAAPTPVASITINLGPGRDGDQSGTATLTARGDKTEVVLNIKPGAAGVAQPAHIHVGTCPVPGAVKYPLSNVVDGKSTTTVDASLGTLLAGGLAINAHLSAAEAAKYVACGNIPQGVVFNLDKGRDGDQPGVAVLLAQDTKTEVNLFIKPGAAGVAQPVHIHEGACPVPGAVKFPLTNVVDGKSKTVVDVSLASLQAGTYAINVHLSAAEAAKYVACGNVPRKVTLNLGAGRDGDQPGTATLTAMDTKTEVVLNIKPGPAGVAQPAHIHVGTCPVPGAVKFPLANVVDGKSTTIVEVALTDLLKDNYAINVHLSAAEAAKYVACGDVKVSASAPASTSTGASSSSKEDTGYGK